MFGEKKQNQNQEELPVAPETSKEEIYIMPARLRKDKGKTQVSSEPSMIARPATKKTFPLWLIWLILFILIIGFVGVFYFKSDFIFSLFKPQKNGVVLTNQLINQPVLVNKPEEEQPKPSLAGTVTVSPYFELVLPEGALAAETNLTAEAISLPEEQTEKYKTIGQVFKLSSLVSLLKPVTLTISYAENEVESFWEDDLKIGYWQESYWILLPTESDLKNNKLTSQLNYLPSQIYTILVLKEKTLIQPGEKQEIAPGVYSASDIDQDALTDKEEEIYRTDKNNPDTDKDSYPDGLEIVHLYSPLSGPGDRLATSNLVRSYRNPTYPYSVFYPTHWPVKGMTDSGDKEILFVTETGELIEIIVQENTENLPVLEWYKKQVKDLEVNKIRTMKVPAGEGVWSLDGLTFYLGKEDKIYLLAYQLGGAELAHFKSTFLMMLKSFSFLETTTDY